MKKLFVIAVFLVVIGILCAVFFIRPNTQSKSDEKPWTVGDETEAETVRETTTKKAAEDAVSAFSLFVDQDLRSSLTYLNEGESFSETELVNAVLGLYMYDIDTDGTEELAVVRAAREGVYLDLYEYGSGKVRLADTLRLVLDSDNNVTFEANPAAYTHMAARMRIYPQGSDRYICLTVEQQGEYSDYNAYTMVMEYAKEQLRINKSYRLRRIGTTVTLMCLDDATLLYRSSADDGAGTGEDETRENVSLAQYSNLDKAFQTEFAKLGLTAPQTKMENGTLAMYKVTAVPSEQHVFEFTMEDGKIRIIENGFLQSFLIRH